MQHGLKLFDAEKDTRRAEFPEDRLIQSFHSRYPMVSPLVLFAYTLWAERHGGFEHPMSKQELQLSQKKAISASLLIAILCSGQAYPSGSEEF